ncbi:hypothetical protein D6D01_06582 [Aureobasidium pullulans]|uniref:Uncharacterized protein n=1 Tax=Aureobasidium pullulans TaxID=5580 RepID=A0A4S9KYA0_AURPU|nr:hypothetical protein D6D01_06582 [Aureobasidium pullulans]
MPHLSLFLVHLPTHNLLTATMVNQWNTAKDMLVLLAIVRISKIDVNLDVAENIVAGWRKSYTFYLACTRRWRSIAAMMGEVSADAEGILSRIEEIWQKSISSVDPPTPAVAPSPSSTTLSRPPVSQYSTGSCHAETIVILDSDDEDVEISTPISSRPLPRTFRVPPGLDLVTPRSNKKSPTLLTATSKGPKVIVDFEDGGSQEESVKKGSPKLNMQRPNTALPTPKSIEKASKTIDTRNKRKLRISTTRKVAETHKSKADQNTIETPSTISGTRKRRRIDYEAVPTAWLDKDNSDSNYEFEEAEGDERLDAMYDKSCPVITPSKPPEKG